MPIYAKRFDDNELEKMLFWHALPENWQEMYYRDFLSERRKLISKAVEEAYKKL